MSGYRRPHNDVTRDDEPFVPLVRPVDPMQASLVEQMLREERIPCRVLGTRDAALIGVAQHAMALRIEVPQSRLAHAEEVLAALDAPDAIEPLPDDDEEEEDEEESAEAPRRVVLAVGATMLFFGGSHFYARRPWTAAVLAVTQLSAILVTLHQEFPDRFMGGVTMMLVLLVDAVFGARATLAYNRGVRPGVGAQLASGVLLATIVVAVATLLALREAG